MNLPQPPSHPSAPLLRSPSPLPAHPSGRPRRHTRIPKKFVDMIPHGNEPVPCPDPLPLPPAKVPVEPRAPSPPSEQQWIRTDRNVQGVYKVFPRRPTRDPEDSITLDDLCHAPGLF